MIETCPECWAITVRSTRPWTIGETVQQWASCTPYEGHGIARENCHGGGVS